MSDPADNRSGPTESPWRLMRRGRPAPTGALVLAVLAAFGAMNAFWRHLTAGEWVSFRPFAFYQDLSVPIGEVLRHPLDVLTHPWMIVVTGLLLGLALCVPIVVAVLYRSLLAAPFVLAIILLGHAPVLALAVAVGCALGGRSRLRHDLPFLGSVLGLLPAAAYLTLSAVAGVDAAAVLPLQRWALYAPFLIAFVSAVLAEAVVLTLARVTGFRSVAVCPALIVLMAAPAAVFHLRVGRDELAYALIVNRSRDERVRGDDAIFEDDALGPWVRRHGALGLNPQTTRTRVAEDMDLRRDELLARSRKFLACYPDSPRRAAVLWLRAQAASLMLDEGALAVGLIQHTAAFPLPESAEAWQELASACPTSPQAALAHWRLGELALRAVASPTCDDPNQCVRRADEHLHRAAEVLGALFPAAADRAETPEPNRIFTPHADLPGREYSRTALEAVERLLWTMKQNRVLKDPNSAEALATYLDLNPKQPSYYQRLALLLSDGRGRRERTLMGDNLKLAVALQTPDAYERAEMLIQLANDERTDAAIVANFELGKLALRTAEARAIGLVAGLKTPGEYFHLVIAAPPNPYQRKAAELLAALAGRTREE